MENKKHIFGDLYFIHGVNFFGKHTDWIIEVEVFKGKEYIHKFLRKPTKEEKEKYCGYK